MKYDESSNCDYEIETWYFQYTTIYWNSLPVHLDHSIPSKMFEINFVRPYHLMITINRIMNQFQHHDVALRHNQTYQPARSIGLGS